MKNLLGILVLTVAAVGCATTGTQSLMNAAAHLDDSSQRFYEQAKRSSDLRDRESVVSEASALARAAHDFHRSLDREGARVDVQDEFHRVAERYNGLHDRLADSGYAERDRQELRDFDYVTKDYRAVESAMNSGRYAYERDDRRYRREER